MAASTQAMPTTMQPGPTTDDFGDGGPIEDGGGGGGGGGYYGGGGGGYYGGGGYGGGGYYGGGGGAYYGGGYYGSGANYGIYGASGDEGGLTGYGGYANGNYAAYGYYAAAPAPSDPNEVSEIVVTARKGAESALNQSGLDPAVYYLGIGDNQLPELQQIVSNVTVTLQPKFENFFNKILAPATKIANALGIPVNFVLGLAAYESGYFSDAHDQALNNPFGLTAAGGNDLSYSSLDAAADSFIKNEGWRFSDQPQTVQGFIADIGKSPAFNSVNDAYSATLTGIISSSTARLAVYNHEHGG